MAADASEKPSDGRLVGVSARAIRRMRGLTARQVAEGMGLPLRTYEYFESGTGRPNLDYIHRFARATDSDPYAMLLGLGLGDPEFARRCADNKLMLIFLIALGEFNTAMTDRIPALDARSLIEAFTGAFRALETDSAEREASASDWLRSGRARLDGDPADPED